MMYHYIVIRYINMHFCANTHHKGRKELIGMVVSDVDGTLIYKGSNLNTARFPVMLSKLSERSVTFAVATGRHYRELKKLFGKSIRDLWCCCCDGAYVISNDEIVYSLPVPKNCVKAFFESFAHDPKCSVVFHSFDTSYILGGTYLVHAKESSRLGNVKKIAALSEIDCDIFFVSVYGHSAENFEPPVGTRVAYRAQGVCEFVNRHASKYDAVKRLANLYNKTEKDILFFGDGENDRELIENCGMSYTTYCADKKVFALTPNHTRDCIGTIIRLCDEKKLGVQQN